MKQPGRFNSALAPHFDRFVQLRRATGVTYVNERNMLLAFDRFLASQSCAPVSAATMSEYLTLLERLSPRGRDNVIVVVWSAIAYAKHHGAAIERLPMRPRPAPPGWRERQPRIVTPEEIRVLLAGAGQLPPVNRPRSATLATLLGLLYNTGLRIGEALALDIGDLDHHDKILTVRRGKFGKSRALPLQTSTTEALTRYIADPRRGVSTEASAPIFVSCHRRRLKANSVSCDFALVCRIAGIDKPWPRPHDLRHTFAVGRIAAWYEQGRDINALLPVLSTWLGHVSVEHTRRYLVANGALLEHAAARFESSTRSLDEVRR